MLTLYADIVNRFSIANGYQLSVISCQNINHQRSAVSGRVVSKNTAGAEE